jgi:hypothetical protein
VMTMEVSTLEGRHLMRDHAVATNEPLPYAAIPRSAREAMLSRILSLRFPNPLPSA